MRKSRRGAAFYVETLLLVLFLLFCLTVLVRVLGTAKLLSREARELSCAVRIAQNAAEQLAASDSRAEFSELLGAQETDGKFVLQYDADGLPTADRAAAVYTLVCDCSGAPQGPGTMLTAHLTVMTGTEIVYELDTQKYAAG